MKFQMKNTQVIMLIYCILFKGALTEKVSEDSCDREDEAMGQWYTHVFQFVKTNENATQDISQLKDNLRILEAKVQTKLEHLEIRAEETYKKLENHEQILQTMHDQMQQLQQKTNGEIIIQRRQDGSVDFYRTWLEYKQGFGDPNGEFFIGLDKLHKLTNSRPYGLLIIMEDWENERRYASYSRFLVGSEFEKYELKTMGTFKGSTGDSMYSLFNQKFSTKDQDNDRNGTVNCAVQYTGAWWYRDCPYSYSNLNGLYLKGKVTRNEFGKGVVWTSYRGIVYSLKFVEMSLVPSSI